VKPAGELEELCAIGATLYARGYAHGSTGNLSVRLGDRIFITPTGRSLRDLSPDVLAEVTEDGSSLNANKPSKEAPFHLALYRKRPEARAIVHLHSTYSVALSCLDDLDEAAPLPPITPYYFMRVAPLGVLPYFRPGAPGLADAIEAAAPRHHCLLLRNHGSVCSGSTMNEALDRAEELEATAKLHFLLRGEKLRLLTTAQVEELGQTFGRP
jgi:3-dehydro-4-phosphotetronate decarboxylase